MIEEILEEVGGSTGTEIQSRQDWAVDFIDVGWKKGQM